MSKNKKDIFAAKCRKAQIQMSAAEQWVHNMERMIDTGDKEVDARLLELNTEIRNYTQEVRQNLAILDLYAYWVSARNDIADIKEQLARIRGRN